MCRAGTVRGSWAFVALSRWEIRTRKCSPAVEFGKPRWKSFVALYITGSDCKAARTRRRARKTAGGRVATQPRRLADLPDRSRVGRRERDFHQAVFLHLPIERDPAD